MKVTTEKKDNQGRENKTMYWLVLKNNKGTETVLNVGQKTYEGVQKMIEEEAALQPELPLENKLQNENTESKEDKPLANQGNVRRR